MIYSRKSQFVLLLCWLLSMTVMYVRTTGKHALWLVKADELIVDRAQKARLGPVPEMPVPATPPVPTMTPPPPPVPDPAPRPAADPSLNRCLAVRVNQDTDNNADILKVELDYVAAQTKGFTFKTAHGYCLVDAPVFVVELGEPWTSDIGNASFPGTMPQITGLDLIVSKSRHLRLLVRTRSMRIAQDAKLHISPTDTGMRAEIRLPRQQ